MIQYEDLMQARIDDDDERFAEFRGGVYRAVSTLTGDDMLMRMVSEAKTREELVRILGEYME